jgi:hypothetical protein
VPIAPRTAKLSTKHLFESSLLVHAGALVSGRNSLSEVTGIHFRDIRHFWRANHEIRTFPNSNALAGVDCRSHKPEPARLPAAPLKP